MLLNFLQHAGQYPTAGDWLCRDQGGGVLDPCCRSQLHILLLQACQKLDSPLLPRHEFTAPTELVHTYISFLVRLFFASFEHLSSDVN